MNHSLSQPWWRTKRIADLSFALVLCALALRAPQLVCPAAARDLDVAFGPYGAARLGEGASYRPVAVSHGPQRAKELNHWMLGAELSGRGETGFGGVRNGVSHYQDAFLVRLGPFLGATFFSRDVGPVHLSAYGEGSLYLEFSREFSFVPGAGLGLNVGVGHGMVVGLYGGPYYYYYLSSPGADWGGELRTTLLYAIGRNAAH